ncbi:MAG: hypothetical protein US52_C0006G0021 [candidate division WS6 bacterium GW2011_GWA2_37_6]|uniref:Uncharacterized protein n=1 Tax=candidate division WS6 bacterium GW2011_GWA2_37_6 TaxID=1619087 RepID=A0A0G0K6D9_9BACT|nr:MAG: hypothetical protein US52_C0006G0021 [candidate division WS6 bacterium GW2011_GWA2_37_6]
MATKETDSPKLVDIESEPDFEVVQMPVDQLEDIGVSEIEKVPEVSEDKAYVQIKQKREGARNSFAIIFLVGFLILLFVAMVIGFLMEGDQLDNTKEILLTISGILSGPMGFVIGYYFRRSEE